MSSNKSNVTKVFYGVIGVSTLMLAIIGATFAYFTATQSNATVIKGNMATIDMDVTVTKVTSLEDKKGGVVPLSNNMIEAAVLNSNKKGVCVDDNGNAVCQIYKIAVINKSTASMFVDGYVNLSRGSGVETDVISGGRTTSNMTTMRWAQVFCNSDTLGENSEQTATCTTAGRTTVGRGTDTVPAAWGVLGSKDNAAITANGKNEGEIFTAAAANTLKQADIVATGGATLNGNAYDVIKKNYIRISDHPEGNTTYQRGVVSDLTSALVLNQRLDANDNNAGNNTGQSNSTYVDAQVYYIAVWLTETGTNQTANSGLSSVPAAGNDFFSGSVTFSTSRGNEVTATFAGTSRVVRTDYETGTNK